MISTLMRKQRDLKKDQSKEKGDLGEVSLERRKISRRELRADYSYLFEMLLLQLKEWQWHVGVGRESRRGRRLLISGK